MSKENEGSANDIQKEMEKFLGIESVDELFKDIPDSIRLKNPLKLLGPMSERDLTIYIDKKLSLNKQVVSFLGGGAQDHNITALVQEVIKKTEIAIYLYIC